MARFSEEGVTVWDVQWHTAGSGVPFANKTSVALTEGYSTMDDIPKIIATRRTGDPSLAYLVIIDSITAVRA